MIGPSFSVAIGEALERVACARALERVDEDSPPQPDECPKRAQHVRASRGRPPAVRRRPSR